MKTPAPTFWVTNISNRNVSLADLNLTIKAFSSVNLMDKKHYAYTLEQLQKSSSTGSIHAKQDKIVIRKTAPTVLKLNVPFDHETYIPSRERSTFSIKEEYYEELNITDDDYANESAEMIEADNTPPTVKKA